MFTLDDNSCLDPLALQKMLWPDTYFWSKQREILYSIRDNKYTEVPAANDVGKDFVAGYVPVWRMLTAVKLGRTCKIVTHSIRDDHLDVLWGETSRWLKTAKSPLLSTEGGPLRYNHREIMPIRNGQLDEMSYVKGIVSRKGEGLSGHHADDTVFIGDEASGIDDIVEEMTRGWVNKYLYIGNCNPTTNFFYKQTEEGDKTGTDGSYYRKVIRIRAEDSPNVRLGLEEIANGKKPSNKRLVPGIITYAKYLERRTFWDKVAQCVGLDAQFWKGSQQLLFPPDWLHRAEQLYRDMPENVRVRRKAKGIGVDPGEGGADTSLCAVDEWGIIELYSELTPDTSVIPGMVLAFMLKHGVPPERVCFDRGGGGKQHADLLRAKDHNVRTVAFGEGLLVEPKRGIRLFKEKVENREDRYIYINRRAQMYHELSMLLDPAINPEGFAIPDRSFDPIFAELRSQLCLIPKLSDEEGRYWMLPKNKKDSSSKQKTLIELIGRSPDEADATVLAVYAMLHDSKASTIAGAVG